MSLAQVKVSIPEGSLYFAGDTNQVKIEFDTKYRIRIDNSDQYRRVLVKVRIDGSEATDDGLIIRTDETVNLERFVNSKTLQSGKRFKFIERNAALADGHRPNKEDGLIVVSVQFEKRKGKLIEYKEYAGKGLYVYPICDSLGINIWQRWGNSLLSVGTQPCSGGLNVPDVDLSPGVTIEGSISSQRFQEEKVGDLEDRIDKIVIRLMGYYKESKILLNK